MKKDVAQHTAGASRTAVLGVVLLLCLAGGVGYGIWRNEGQTRSCAQQLKQIYQALERYELDHGTLPHLALYPDDPAHDPRSLLVVLDPYAVTSEIGICPKAHALIRKQGLTYIWNAALIGTHLQDHAPDTWLVMELSGLSDHVRAPHWGRHLVLYVDGTVRRVRTPPPILPP